MNALPANRSQSWFRPGRYIPVQHVRGVEVLPSDVGRAGVQVSKTTIHGRPDELRSLAFQILAAVVRTERQAA